MRQHYKYDTPKRRLNKLNEFNSNTRFDIPISSSVNLISSGEILDVFEEKILFFNQALSFLKFVKLN